MGTTDRSSHQNRYNPAHVMRSTLLRTTLALLLPLAWAGAMAQTPQAPDCNVCSCGALGTPSLATPIAAPACPGSSFGNIPAGGATNLRFNTVAGNRYRVRLCGAVGLNTILYIRNTGSPYAAVMGACDDDGCGTPGGPSSVEFVAAAAQYRVYVYDGGAAPACAAFATHPIIPIQVECLGTVAAPANDDPCGAVALPLASTSCSSPVAGTTEGATQTNADLLDVAPLNPNLGCGAMNFGGSDVWYSTTVPASGLIGVEVQESGVCATGLAFYTAPNCSPGPYTWLTGTPTGVCSIDGLPGPNSPTAFVFDPATYALAVGQTIYIRVWERNNNENGSFTICAYNAVAPSNDEPCGATLLTVGDPCVPAEYNTVNAQPKPPGLTVGNMSCGMPGAPYATPALWNPVARDVWFQVVVPPLPSNGMTVTTFAGTLDDMAMSWYRATGAICAPYGGSLTQIASACHDNIGGGNNMPRINSATMGIPLTPGETIYIRVWNREALQYFYHGTFSICVTPNNPPPNDDPCGAIHLDVGAECVLTPATNENATNTGLTFLPGASSAPAPCGAPPANYNDVWFTVDVPIDLTAPNGLIFDTDDQAPLNFAMAAYRDISGSGCPTLVQLAAVGTCSTAGSLLGNAAMPRLQLTVPTITPGERLYIRVWSELNNGQGPFGICAQRISPPDCQGTFYDSGGASGAYANNESVTRLHCAEKAGDVVTLNFSQFNLESGFDNIRIYNQNVIAPLNPVNLIGTFTGTSIPSQISGVSTVANPNGCLVVVFTSDVIIPAPGYTYKVSCGPPPLPIVGACGINAYTPGLVSYPGSMVAYDPGGAGGMYPGNLGVQSAAVPPFHAIYCPNTPGEAVTMTFNSFDIEDNFDGLYVFDANIPPGTALNTPAVIATQFNSGNGAQLTWSGPYSPAVPPNGAYWGNAGPGTITATNPTGCITLVLYSDAIVSGTGWDANVSCGPPPPPPPATPCDGTFYETVGGSSGNYGNNVSATQTFCGVAGRILTATFQSFNLEANWDKMYVFDGPTTASPMISSGNGVGFGPAPYGPGAYWGNAIPGPFSTSTPGGCLTFHFVTDASVVRPGWVAKLRCPAPPANDNPCAAPAPVTGATLITPGPTCAPVSSTNVDAAGTTGIPAPGCANYAGGDVWFRFVAPPSGRVFIDTHAGTLSDAGMALYSSVACAGPFTLIECDDDDGEGLMPSIDRMCSPLTPGATYWIRVWGYGDRRGTFDLCVVEGPSTTSVQTDCGGAFSLCNSTPFAGIAYGNGCGPDLVPTNWGCLAGERQGSWYAFRTNAAGNLAMTITPSSPVDIDWAIWSGNLAGLPTPVGASCMPAGAPVRCSFGSLANTMNSGGANANPTAATGMGRNAFTPATPVFAAPTPAVNDATDGWVSGITVAANQMYLLFVDDHHLEGVSYNVAWTETPAGVIGCQILPVEALQLEAAPQTRTVDLLWSTTREQNTSHFIIERSPDGNHFSPIGAMASVGNAESLTNYHSVDDAPVMGLNYYRLTLVDMDGTTTVSNTVTALFKPNGTTVMVVPNPARDQAELLLSAAHDAPLHVRISDGSGRMVASFVALAGMQRMDLPIAKLEGGSYTVQLLTEKGESFARTRFVKH